MTTVPMLQLSYFVHVTEEGLQIWRQCDTLRSGLSYCLHVIEFHTDGFVR